MLTPTITMREALSSHELFGLLLPGESWAAWRVLLIAAVGEELTPDEREIFARLTGRPRELGAPCEELWGIISRRGGKTRAIAVLGAWLATCFDYEPILAPGETGQLPILSASTLQGLKVRRYLNGLFENAPALHGMIERATTDTLVLRNRVEIVIRASNYRTIRGETCIGAICDELAFWPNDEESKNPDAEVLAALRPALATTGGMLAVISSPFARKGEVWEAFRRYWGVNGDQKILVAKAASRTMNPTLPESLVARAYERDAASAEAEYGGQFRSDLESYVSPEAVDAVVTPGKFEAGALANVAYCAFVDAAGGSGRDAMTMAIGHMEEDVAVLDVLRGVSPPFSPKDVVRDFAGIMRQYQITRAKSDHWGGSWVGEAFKEHGIDVEPAAKAKSELYRELLPALNSGGVSLLDHRKLISELTSLERRTARSGRDSIDHPTNGFDDYANSAAGCLVDVLRGEGRLIALGAYMGADGHAVPVPMRPNIIFASVVVGNGDGQAAATIWARSVYSGVPLALLDFEVELFSDQFLRGLHDGLGRWCDELECGRYMLVGDPTIVDRWDVLTIERLEPRAASSAIGDLAQHPQLPGIVAGHVNGGKVKLTTGTLEKAQRHPLGAALDLRFSGAPTPLQLSAINGIAAGLEGS
jgi:hypothetical protein